MRWLTLFGFLFAVSLASGQSNSPPIQWQSSFGGTNDDLLNSAAQLQDGSLVLAGVSMSGIDGNKTNAGGTNGWLVFMDAAGNKTGELSLTNGGTPSAVIATADGGFLASASVPVGGGPSATSKFAANRSAQWLFPFGGAVQQTLDGGYIVLGVSSNAVLTKLSGSGTQQWIRDVTDTDVNTLAHDIRQTADGGYVGALVARPPPNHVHRALVVRWDASGNELWRTNLSGTFDQELRAVRQMADGGFVLAGYTQNQPIIGGNTVYADAWVVRLSSAGAKLSEVRYGGGRWDEFRQVEALADGGLLLAGISFSEPGPFITKQAPKYGDRDFWLLRVDASGNRLWDATYGGTNGFLGGRNDFAKMIFTRDGGILLAGDSDSAPSGNKTAPNFGSPGYFDYWVLKAGEVLPLTSTRNGNDLQINFNGEIGKTYVLQARNDFTTNNSWAATGQTLVASSNGPAFFTIPRTNAMRFFRVGVD